MLNDVTFVRSGRNRDSWLLEFIYADREVRRRNIAGAPRKYNLQLLRRTVYKERSRLSEGMSIRVEWTLLREREKRELERARAHACEGKKGRRGKESSADNK